MRLSLGNWLSFSRMNVICCGETSVGMCGATTNALRFQSSMNGRNRHTMGHSTSTRKSFSSKPMSREILSPPLLFSNLCWQNALNAESRSERDGASYHRSQEVRAYLESVNQGVDESFWKITCIRFAPNAPEQNPVEELWLHAKRFIREFYHLCKSFSAVKRLFELVTPHQIFDFPKLFMYGAFSQMV